MAWPPHDEVDHVRVTSKSNRAKFDVLRQDALYFPSGSCSRLLRLREWGLGFLLFTVSPRCASLTSRPMAICGSTMKYVLSSEENCHGLKLISLSRGLQRERMERTVVATVTEALGGSVSLLVRRCCLLVRTLFFSSVQALRRCVCHEFSNVRNHAEQR